MTNFEIFFDTIQAILRYQLNKPQGAKKKSPWEHSKAKRHIRLRIKVLEEGPKYDFIFLNMIFVHPIDQKLLAKVKHEKLNNFFHEPMSMLYFCENVASIKTKKISEEIFDNCSHA